MEEAVSDIDDSVQRLVAQAMAEAAAENEKVRQAGESQPAEDLSDTAEFPAQKVQPEEKRGHGKDHPDRLWRASVRSGL
mgnify:CR=1 FL=1